MKPLNKEQIEQVWKNLVYSPKQVDEFGLDLTVKSIYAFVDRGKVDFGGYSKGSQNLISYFPSL